MCALFGWLDCGGKVSIALLAKLTQALANAAEERGTDAAGISYVRKGKVTVYKRPKPAHKIKFRIPVGTRAVMGHTRLTTQGSEKNNRNNHPFKGHAGIEFAFAHNGCLYNDTRLRISKQLPETDIETDSYIGVQLIESAGSLDFKSLGSMAEAVNGSFMFTLLDSNNKLYFIKGSNPISILYFKDLKLYVYASTDTILSTALFEVGLSDKDAEKRKLIYGDMLSIDVEGNIEESEFDDKDEYLYTGSLLGNWNYRYARKSKESELEILYEYAGYFGVSEEKVDMLIEYGYTSLEVEELLYDDDALEKTLQEITNIYGQTESVLEDHCDIYSKYYT